MKKALSFVKHKSKLLITVVASLIVGGSTVGVVLAAIPDASGVIHACYTNKDGTLRIIDDSSATCTNKETALNWNQVGPQGPPGISGSGGKTLKAIIDGQEYGPVVDGGQGSFQYFDEQLGRMVHIGITGFSTNRALVGEWTGYDYYLTADCSGTPYVFVQFNNLENKTTFYNNVYALDYNNRAIINQDEPVISITPVSKFTFNASTGTTSCDPYTDGVPRDVLPMTPVTLPFSGSVDTPWSFVYD